MTIEVQLSPDLESLARARANEEYAGDLQALLQAVIRDYLVNNYDDETDKKLLEAIDSPGQPLPADWRELVYGQD